MYSFLFAPTKGIAPITVVTHRDKLSTEEECENALYAASAATGSLPSDTFLLTNYSNRAYGFRHSTLRAVEG